MRLFHTRVWLICVCLLSCWWPPEMQAQQKKQLPNIILILVDDAGYADFSFMSNRLIATPNIDRIANEGARFTNAYITCSVCSPSRAGILTGVNQARFGHVYNYVRGVTYNIPADSFGLPLSQRLVGDYLKPLGYTTGMVGKWHEGLSAQFRPDKRGFDYWWGFLWGASNYLTGKAKEVQEDGVAIPADSIPYMTDAISNKALGFIERNQHAPFFLYVSFNAVHAPMEAEPAALDKFKGKFADKGRVAKAAMTWNLDENVGRILQKLDTLHLLENTLIIFTNDNGGQTLSFSDNYPLRGKKGDLYEGGLRVPMAMMWKGKVQPGLVYNGPVTSLDFLPTFLAAANTDARQYPMLEGINLLPFVNTAKRKAPLFNRSLYWYIGLDRGAVRSGDWKLVCYPGQPPALYRLSTDIGETTELSAQYPAKAKQLFRLYSKWQQSLPTPSWIPQLEKDRNEIQ